MGGGWLNDDTQTCIGDILWFNFTRDEIDQRKVVNWEKKVCIYLCVCYYKPLWEYNMKGYTPIKNHNNNNNEERKNDTKFFSRFYRFCVSDVASFIDLLV